MKTHYRSWLREQKHKKSRASKYGALRGAVENSIISYDRVKRRTPEIPDCNILSCHYIEGYCELRDLSIIDTPQMAILAIYRYLV